MGGTKTSETVLEIIHLRHGDGLDRLVVVEGVRSRQILDIQFKGKVARYPL